jgi:hypothetical protein
MSIAVTLAIRLGMIVPIWQGNDLASVYRVIALVSA